MGAVVLVNYAVVSFGGGVSTVLTTMKIKLVAGIGLGAFLFGNGNWWNYGRAPLTRSVKRRWPIISIGKERKNKRQAFTTRMWCRSTRALDACAGQTEFA